LAAPPPCAFTERSVGSVGGAVELGRVRNEEPSTSLWTVGLKLERRLPLRLISGTALWSPRNLVRVGTGSGASQRCSARSMPRRSGLASVQRLLAALTSDSAVPHPPVHSRLTSLLLCSPFSR
jgi:hypothetical protein